MSGRICTTAWLVRLMKKVSHDLAEQFRGVAAIEKAHEERYRKLLKNVEAKEVFEKAELLSGNAVIAVLRDGCQGSKYALYANMLSHSLKYVQKIIGGNINE